MKTFSKPIKLEGVKNFIIYSLEELDNFNYLELNNSAYVAFFRYFIPVTKIGYSYGRHMYSTIDAEFVISNDPQDYNYMKCISDFTGRTHIKNKRTRHGNKLHFINLIYSKNTNKCALKTFLLLNKFWGTDEEILEG